MTSALSKAIQTLEIPGLLAGCRAIAPGDDKVLLEAEAASLPASGEKAWRASGAPDWPQGLIGSLAHDDTMAVAAVARAGTAASIGIDIEPAEVMAPHMTNLVVTPQERVRLADDPFRGRLLFVAKEAVYKAAHPLDGLFLDYPDIEIDLNDRSAITRSGRRLALRFCISTHLVVLAIA